ncbi:AraC family transcriptional regulator [Myxococcus stipitatus]|uniref:AraC family transcriptional regulator n=1 Tax=Myxococcus stipitatus TaxID=83455 RepID=UPI0031455044
MTDRPSCYPSLPPALLKSLGPGRMPLLDVLTSPVPSGRFDSPVDDRHVLCLHVGEPVPVTYRVGKAERQGARLHGQFCVVPAGSSTRWTLSRPARSLLLRLTPELMREAAEAMGLGTQGAALDPAIHIRDAQVERIGWMMQSEDLEGYPGGRLFADSLATALAARLFALQSHTENPEARHRHALPAWRLRQVVEYIEAHLDEDLSLAELAQVAGFSLSHFKPLFKRATGVPVHRFVLERRVERARLRLVEGRKSLMEIAMEAGFSHPSHMARCLRRFLGMSPTEIARASQ